MKKSVRILIIVLSIIVIFCIVGFVMFQSMQKGINDLLELEMTDIDLTDIEDGDYIGTYQQLPVTVKVTVKIVNHDIISIEILKHDNGQGQSAELIINDIVEEDSILVDTVAGATISSKCIQLAVKNALNKK